MLKEVDPNNSWNEVEGATILVQSEKLDLSYANGAWSKTVYTNNVSVGLNVVTDDGTWQLSIDGEDAIASGYYKIPAIIDGVECNILAQYNGDILIVYPNFFPALGGAVPANNFVIAEGAMLKAVDPNNSWNEVEGATAMKVAAELKVENIYGQWYEMSKYADVTFTEIYAADLELYYQNIIKLEDYSEAEINMYLAMNPEYKPLYNQYGKKANMTTFGIKSKNPNLVIPNDANWSTMTLMGKITTVGATAAETYAMQTVASSTDDSSTAMDSAFLIRFYNGYILEQATTITIEPGTKIITASGAGFVFVDGYTICSNSADTWANHAYTATVTAPTCTDDGFTTYACSSCGDSYTRDIVAALGHQLGENGVCVNGGETLVSVDGTYLPMAEALELGKDIQLIADTTAQNVVLDAGVTLDLNGYTLTAQSVDATAPGAQIMGKGLLKANAEFNENNSQLPIYDAAAEGYRFFEVSVEAVAVTGKNSGNPKYWFKLNFANIEEVCKLIQAGSEVNVAVKMAWNGGEAEATADADFLAKWAANGGDCYITVSAVNAENLENFSLTPCVTANGVSVDGGAM